VCPVAKLRGSDDDRRNVADASFPGRE
jgi:hypothetical protein